MVEHWHTCGGACGVVVGGIEPTGRESLEQGALHRWTRLEIQDYVAVLQLENGYAVSEMTVETEDWLAGKTLQEAALTNEGVLVLGIKRPDGAYLGAPRGAARIETDDVLILYAPIRRLEELDRRRAGPPGEMAHEEAVAENVESGAG